MEGPTPGIESMDKQTRNLIQKATQDARNLLEIVKKRGRILNINFSKQTVNN
jgi:hypothetical protein